MAIRFGRIFCIAVVMLALTAASLAQISVVVSFGPPSLPVYVQPPCPAEGYIWTPGYWAYDPDFGDYYWVPGTWVLVPVAGYFWTPGWWGWGGNGFIFYEGYWGPQVGFYGGINYGYGYFGHGYEGGRWDNGRFFYNRSVNNVNVTNIHNVYNTTVINNTTVNRVSYNGGNGGITARPTSQEEAAAREKRIPPVAAQTEHMQAASANPQLRASVNHGKPPIAATPTPGAFQGHGVVPAKQAGGPYTPPPANRVANARPETNVPRPSTAVHPNELPPIPRPPAANTGNAEQDQKYQQQAEQLRAQQQQERQKLQQQQEQEHQQLAQQQANAARQQQLEQQHRQQTQQLQQQHAQQQQQQLAHQQQQPHENQGKPPKN